MIFLPLLLSVFSFAGELDGQWRQDCSRAYFREEIFLGESATYTEHNFRDTACLRPVVDLISRGIIVSGAPVLEPLGARELDFTFSSVSLIPRDQAAADFYESKALCGLTGWKLNEEKEITGLLCDFFGLGSSFRIPAAGLKKFGIVSRKEEALYFGRLSPERDGSSILKRPRELDSAPYKLVR